jgi:hypothetical protein
MSLQQQSKREQAARDRGIQHVLLSLAFAPSPHTHTQQHGVEPKPTPLLSQGTS